MQFRAWEIFQLLTPHWASRQYNEYMTSRSTIDLHCTHSEKEGKTSNLSKAHETRESL